MTQLPLSALGLVVDDRDPQALIDTMVATYLELAPDAQLVDGSIEAILMEAHAAADADVIYALNRVITLVEEGIVNRFGVARSIGTPAAGSVLLTLDGTRTMTVAAGQRMSHSNSGVLLEVTTNTSVTAGTSITVPVASVVPGAAGNQLSAGTPIDLVDSIPNVASAQVATGLSGGTDPESDAAYVQRMSLRLARVTSSLVLPDHFIAYCLEDVRVGKATAIDLYEPGGTAGSDLGHITIVIYGHAAALSAEILEELRAGMHAISSSSHTVHAISPTITTQAISLTVHPMPGFTTGEVQAAVTAALQSWMNPDDWPFGRDIQPTEIIEIAGAVPSVDYVVTVATPSSPVTIGDDGLANAGTVTVTVS